MLREAVAMLVLGVTLTLACGVPLVHDEDGTRFGEVPFLVMWYLMIAGVILAGVGALLFWLEVLR